MKTVQQVLYCALLAALTAFVVYAILLVRAATQTIAAIPPEIQATRAALIGEARAARADLSLQIGAARQDALSRSEREVAALRGDVMAQIAETRETADRRIGDTLARADTALNTMDALRQDLKPVLNHSASITAQVDEALPPFLDCSFNQDCVFNRYVGVSQGVERAALNVGRMSQDVSAALPPMLLTWNHIGKDVSGTAANLDRLTKPRWYDRLIGYGLNGVLIYRNLNPATNLIVTGAQALSARP